MHQIADQRDTARIDQHMFKVIQHEQQVLLAHIDTSRRQAFVLYMISAAVLVTNYGQMARSPMILLLLGPLLGYFGYGYFSMFGGFVAELYPAAVRATGQGTSYNIGRMAGAIAPFTIGVIATLPGIGIGLALSVTSAFFRLAAALVFTLPNRSGQALDA